LRFIYFCWGSAHSSITAASVHLGRLPLERRPSVREVMNVPKFDWLPNRRTGHLMLMGLDSNGNEVYALGLGRHHANYKYLISRYLELLGLTPADYRLLNCLPCVNGLTRIGGFSSRSLGAVWFGRRLAAWGVTLSYRHYTRLVSVAKRSRAQDDAFLDWTPPL
jgi:hypothetical protein